MQHKFLPINISAQEVIDFLKDMSNDINYTPTDTEIGNIIALFLFFEVINFLACSLCKYAYWFVCGGLIWLLYLDAGVDEDV